MSSMLSDLCIAQLASPLTNSNEFQLDHKKTATEAADLSEAYVVLIKRDDVQLQLSPKDLSRTARQQLEQGLQYLRYQY